MKKIVLIFTVMLMSLTSTYSTISGLVAQNNKDYLTPIAENYISKTNLDNPFEDLGAKVYSSEEEYLREQELAATSYASSLSFADTAQEVIQTITVVDWKEQKPLSSAVVLLNGVPRFTNLDGLIRVKFKKDQSILLRAEKDGYMPYVEILDAFEGNKVIQIKKPEYDLWVESVIMQYDGDEANLLTQDYTIDRYTQDNECKGKIVITANVVADWYQIVQGDIVVLENESGVFDEQQIAKVFSDEDIYVIVNYENLSFKANILVHFVDTEMYTMKYLMFGGTNISDEEMYDIEQDLDNGVLANENSSELQILNNFKLAGWISKFFDVKLEFVFDNKNNTLKIIMGATIHVAGSGFLDARQSKLRLLKSFTNSFGQNMGKYGVGGNFIQAMKSVFESQRQSDAGKVGDFSAASGLGKIGTFFQNWVKVLISFDILGYYEFNMLTGKAVAGGLVGAANLTVRFRKPIFTPIPFYIELSAGGTFKTTWDIMNDALELALSATFKVAGGIGVPAILSIGIAASFKYDTKWEISSLKNGTWEPHEKGVWQFILGLEYTFLFTPGTVNLLTIPLTETSSNETSATTYATTTLSNLSLASPNEKNSTYRDARPQIVAVGDKKIMTWIDYGEGRDEYNPTCLMYSVYDNGVWSDAKAVYNDGHADLYPELFVNGDDVYVAWSKSKDIYTGESTLLEITSGQEVVVSKFDELSNTFATPTKLTENDTLDAMPKFAKREKSTDPLVLTWQSNTENNIFGDTGINEIYFSEFDGTTWGEPQRILQSEGIINSFDASITDGELVIAVSIDKDAIMETSEDIDIYMVTKDAVRNYTNNGIGSLNPSFAMLGYDMHLFYYEDGNIYYSNDFENYEDRVFFLTEILYEEEEVDEELLNDPDYVPPAKYKVGISDRFQVLSNGYDATLIYGTIIGDNELQLYTSLFDIENMEWCNGVKMNSSEGTLSQFAGVLDSNGQTSYVYTADFFDDETAKRTETRMYYDEFTPEYDIALSDAIMFETPKSGENNIYLRVDNIGAYGVRTIDVEILGQILHVEIDAVLLPNESADLHLTFNINDLTQTNVMTVKVSIPKSESNYLNNETIIQLQYTQIEMEVEEFIIKGTQSFLVKLANIGEFDTNLRLVIRKQDENGEIIYLGEQMFLACGGSSETEVVLDYEALGVAPNDLIYISFESDKETYFKVDDSRVARYEIKEDIVLPEGIGDLLANAKKILGSFSK